MTTDRRREVAVIGGGVIGCSIAAELSTDHGVTVFEKDSIAGGATGRSMGNINPTLMWGFLPEVADEIRAFFDAYDGTGDFEFHRRPRLVLLTPDQEAEARRYAADWEERGVPVSFLDERALGERYPALDLSGFEFSSALSFADGGWVDPYTFTTTLKREAEARDADVRTDTGAVELERAADGGHRVRTGQGVHEADAVVVAAGWRTKGLIEPRASVPTRPFCTNALAFEPAGEIPADFPIVQVNSSAEREYLSFRPTAAGDVLATGGEYVTEDEDRSTKPDQWFVDQVADVLPRIAPGLGSLSLRDGWKCWDCAATPDGLPILDGLGDGSPGVLLATGFNGSGIQLSCIARNAIRRHLTGRESRLPLDRFALDRFEGVSEDFRLTSYEEKNKTAPW